MSSRSMAVPALFLLASCATASGNADGTGSTALPPQMTVSGDRIVTNVAPDRQFSSHRFAAPVDQVWRALGGAYQALEIPIESVNASGRLLGSDRFTARREFAGVPMGDLLDCGFGAGGFMSQNRITFNIQSRLGPAEGGQIELQTLVEAISSPLEGTTNSPVPCTSKGHLEELIAERVKAALGPEERLR